MAVKKDVFKAYIKERESLDLRKSLFEKKEYSENRVFDEPESLKKIIETQAKGLMRIEDEKQTENKLETKWVQTGNKVGTNREQTEHKPETNWVQISDNRIQIGDKLGTKPVTKLETKWVQTGNKVDTKTRFSLVVGLQKSILISIYKDSKISRVKVTDPITLEYLSDQLKASKNSIKTTLKRLEKKELIIRNAFKNGRGGWTKYELPNDVYQEIMLLESQDKLETKWVQTDNKVGTQPGTQPGTTRPSSSSININTTTTKTEENTSISEYVNFDSLKNYGFNSHHFDQLFKINSTPKESLQDSIDHFAFDLEKNNKMKEIRTNPVTYFMGILRREGVYNAPANYESPREKALKQYQENKKKEEEKLKARFGEEYEVYRKQTIRELYENCNDQQKEKILEVFDKHCSYSVYREKIRNDGLNDAMVIHLFNEFVDKNKIDIFERILSFNQFCDTKLDKDLN
jgi:predicted transcriptional regulator